VTVTLVLDTTAVLAYAKGSVAVGELLSIITDDGDTVLIPATCLAEASRQLTAADDALLSILSTIACVELSPLRTEHAAEVGVAARGSAGIDASHTAAEAVARRAQVATQDVAVMSRLLPPGWPVVEV
jgi:rRNA-processing protein FCF1